jgi:hypothetical protein
LTVRIPANRRRSCAAQVGRGLIPAHSTYRFASGTSRGPLTGVDSVIFEDEPVKNALSDYSAEQFEVGCYEVTLPVDSLSPQ